MLLFLIVKPFSSMSPSCFILLGLTQSHFLSDRISSHVFIWAIFIFILFKTVLISSKFMFHPWILLRSCTLLDPFLIDLTLVVKIFGFFAQKMETWKSYQIPPSLSNTTASHLINKNYTEIKFIYFVRLYFPFLFSLAHATNVPSFSFKLQDYRLQQSFSYSFTPLLYHQS